MSSLKQNLRSHIRGATRGPNCLVCGKEINPDNQPQGFVHIEPRIIRPNTPGFNCEAGPIQHTFASGFIAGQMSAWDEELIRRQEQGLDPDGFPSQDPNGETHR